MPLTINPEALCHVRGALTFGQPQVEAVVGGQVEASPLEQPRVAQRQHALPALPGALLRLKRRILQVLLP